MEWNSVRFLWHVRYLGWMFPPDNSWSTVESDGVLVESADQVLPPYTHLLQSLESGVSQ